MNTLTAKPATPDAFRRYGSVFTPPREAPLAETNAFSFWSDVVSYEVEGETEVGWCTIRSHGEPIDWFERHDRTPEMLIPVSTPFILPVMHEDESMEAFRVEVGQAVVIDAGVWHSACLPVAASESSYFVIFRRGTPAEDVIKTEVEGFRIGSDLGGER